MLIEYVAEVRLKCYFPILHPSRIVDNTLRVSNVNHLIRSKTHAKCYRGVAKRSDLKRMTNAYEDIKQLASLAIYLTNVQCDRMME